MEKHKGDKRIHRERSMPEQDRLDRDTDAFLSDMAAKTAFSDKIRKISKEEHPGQGHLLISDEAVSAHFNHLADPIDYEEVRQKSINTRRSVYWQAAAMIATLLVAATIYYILHPGQVTAPGEELFASHYETYHIDPVIRSEWIPDQDNLLQAFFAYEWGQYQTAARRFREAYHATEREGRESLMFFAGVAYLEAGETEEATEALQVVSNNPWSIFYPEAKWYLGLAYLDAGEKDKAREVFAELQKMGRPYPDKVEDILLTLDE